MFESIFTICAAHKVYKNHLDAIKNNIVAGSDMDLMEVVDAMEKELAILIRGHMIRTNPSDNVTGDIDVYQYMTQAITGFSILRLWVMHSLFRSTLNRYSFPDSAFGIQ